MAARALQRHKLFTPRTRLAVSPRADHTNGAGSAWPTIDSNSKFSSIAANLQNGAVTCLVWGKKSAELAPSFDLGTDGLGDDVTCTGWAGNKFGNTCAGSTTRVRRFCCCGAASSCAMTSTIGPGESETSSMVSLQLEDIYAQNILAVVWLPGVSSQADWTTLEPTFKATIATQLNIRTLRVVVSEAASTHPTDSTTNPTGVAVTFKLGASQDEALFAAKQRVADLDEYLNDITPTGFAFMLKAANSAATNTVSGLADAAVISIPRITAVPVPEEKAATDDVGLILLVTFLVGLVSILIVAAVVGAAVVVVVVIMKKRSEY